MPVPNETNQTAQTQLPEGEALKEALLANDKITRDKLVKVIVDFDPVEFSDEVSPGRAEAMADMVINKFHIHPRHMQ